MVWKDVCVFLTGTLPRVVDHHNLDILKSCPLRQQLLSKLASILGVPKELLELFEAYAFSLGFESLGQFYSICLMIVDISTNG